jgi:hypothetical protein
MAETLDELLTKLDGMLEVLTMNIDAMYKRIAEERGRGYAAYCGPGQILTEIVRHGTLEDFEDFYKRFKHRVPWTGVISDKHASLFGTRWMSRLKDEHVRWLCKMLPVCDTNLKFAALVLENPKIAVERRAMFCHVVFGARAHIGRPFGKFALPKFWWYNRCAWNDYVQVVKADSADAYIKRLDVSIRQAPKFSDAMWEGIRNDAPAALEINRELDNRRISDSLLKCLIERDAAKCFVRMLTNRANEVFKLRTPPEWLFTVCRCAHDELAVAAVNELERLLPGFVAHIHDRWGNTPLWSTFFNANPTNKLESLLIRFGCDPDEENEWGLSYRLLKDNPPEA